MRERSLHIFLWCTRFYWRRRPLGLNRLAPSRFYRAPWRCSTHIDIRCLSIRHFTSLWIFVTIHVNSWDVTRWIIGRYFVSLLGKLWNCNQRILKLIWILALSNFTNLSWWEASIFYSFALLRSILIPFILYRFLTGFILGICHFFSWFLFWTWKSLMKISVVLLLHLFKFFQFTWTSWLMIRIDGLVLSL